MLLLPPQKVEAVQHFLPLYTSYSSMLVLFPGKLNHQILEDEQLHGN
jgi:hypothetical protein